MATYALATPVSLNCILSTFLSSRRIVYPIIAPYERLTVTILVHNGEPAIAETVEAVLNQTELPDQILISDNGSRDNTDIIYLVINRLLGKNGYALKGINDQYDSQLRIYVYEKSNRPSITFIQHKDQTCKADSINQIQRYKICNTSRVVIIDSDTILHPRFIERINKNWYTLHTNKDRAVITKSEILGAIVLPKRNSRTVIQEKTTSMAREAEYKSGRFYAKNLKGLHIMNGFSLTCRTENLQCSSGTVTNDTELIEIIQSKKRVTRLNKDMLQKFITENFRLEMNHQLISLAQFLEKVNKPVYLLENNITYVDSAFMYTEDLESFRPLFTQLGRWLGGFHQTFLPHGRSFRKVTKKTLPFVLYGTKSEVLLDSIIFLVLPVLILTKMTTGYGISLKYAYFFYIIDAALQLAGVIITTYKRHKLQEKPRIDSIKHTLLTSIPSFILLYVIRSIYVVQFLDLHLKSLRRITMRVLHLL